MKFRAGAAMLLCLLGVLCALPQAWAADPAPGTHILNTAVANYQVNGVQMPQLSASANVVVGTAAISLTETASPLSVTAGGDIAYTLTVTNTGNTPLTGVKLTDPIPGKTTLVSADSGGTYSAGVASWAIGGLAPLGSETIQLVVKTASGAAGSAITDTSAVTSNEAPVQDASVTNNVVAPLPIEVQFTDSTWAKAYEYSIGDTIYIQVADQNLVTDPTKTGTVVATVYNYTGANDQTVNDSITVTLTETGPGTGVFRGSIASNDGSSGQIYGSLAISSDSRLKVIYTDQVSKISTVDDTALVDPFGTVFNSATGELIGGATVTLVDDATGRSATLPQPPLSPLAQQNPVVTGANGTFRFQYVQPGNYHLVVAPGSDYIYPSAVPAKDLPKNYNVVRGSYGKSFAVTKGMAPLNIDLPVDPPKSSLTVFKTADISAASIGEIVNYTVTVQNTGKTDVTALTITDVMPHGVFYLKGSALIGGKKAPDPAVSGAGKLTFAVGVLPAGASVTLTYGASIGPDSPNGDGINTAFAVGSTATGVLISNRAQFKLVINEGVFTSNGLIIGKIFVDKNKNKIQDPGEEGIPGVTIYMEDGTRVITGTDGKFSIFGVTPETHVLRVDETSLPKGAALEPLSNRFMGDGSTQFVDMPPGGLFKANFAVTGNIEPINPAPAAPVAGTPETAKGKIQLPSAEEDPLEKGIRKMTSALEILSPKDGATAYIAKVSITVKAPSGAALTLYVNGEEVKKHLGKTIKDPVSGIAVYEFISVGITPGENNTIKAETRDASGAITGTSEITLHASGRPEKIVITPDKPEIPADGKTVTEFDIKIFDGKGNIVGYPGTITVESSKGEILDKDADPTESGTQLESSDGEVKFHLKSPWDTGDEKITVTCNGVKATVPVFFSPYLRKMIAIGDGEVAAGFGSTKNRADGTFMSNTWLGQDFFFGGRGAFFAKGDMGWGVLLTATYDSAKKKQDVGLFKSTISNVESEDMYPILGDDSKVGYEALSSDQLYVRAEKGKSSVMYGDFQTNLNVGDLSAFSRTFTGLVTDVNTSHFKMRSFASHTENVQVVDAIPGEGIAGYYFLSKPPIIDGSELVVIETRDWRQPTRVISRVPMARWTDYTIDYEMGSILFKAPVPVRDENYNLVYIIVSYENLGVSKHYVYGGRAAVDPFSWLETGFTGIVQQNDVSDYRLLGSDVTVHLPLKTTVKGEWAQTDSIFTLDDVFTPKVGSAWSLKFDSNPVKDLKASGYYNNVGDYFDNPSATNYLRGTEKYGMDIAYKMAGDLSATGKFFVDDDRLNHMHNNFASAGLEDTFLKIFKAGLDVQYQESNDTFVPTNSLTTRFPFDNSEETPNKLTALKLFIDAKLWKDLTLKIQHTQDVLRNKDNISEVGLEYQYTQSSRFYVRERYMTLEGLSQTQTVAGVESTVAKNTVAFNEYQLDGGSDGSRTQQSIGLRNKFNLGYGVTGNASIEDLRTLSGQKVNASGATVPTTTVPSTANPDTFATSLGVEYLASKDLKASSRFEYRHATGDTSYLGELGCSYKFSRDFFLLTNERYFNDQNASSGGRVLSTASTGIAYRPAWTDIFNALAKFEYKYEKNPAAVRLGENAYIFSADGVLQPSALMQITGKYACKYAVSGNLPVFTDLISLKAYYDLTDRFDIGGTARMMTDHNSGSRMFGGAADVGYRVIKNVWFSVGYSFDKFDSDLTQEDFWGRGPYIKLRVKMDEKSFKKSSI